MAIAIAVIILVVLSAVLLFGASKRRDRVAAGLSKEARQRDKSNPVLSREPQPLTGREVEAAAIAERNEVPVPVVESIPEEVFVAPDPQTLGVTRRQFFNRSLVGMMGFGLSAVTLASCEAPIKKAIPYVNKPVDIDPTIPNYYASSFVSGSDNCSVVVKTREGRPIKIEGNKLSKITG